MGHAPSVDPPLLNYAVTRLHLGRIHNLLTPPAPGPDYILPSGATVCVYIEVFGNILVKACMNSYLVYSTHCEYWKMVDRRENGTAMEKSEWGTARPQGTALDGRSSFHLTFGR